MISILKADRTVHFDRMMVQYPMHSMMLNASQLASSLQVPLERLLFLCVGMDSYLSDDRIHSHCEHSTVSLIQVTSHEMLVC